MKSEVKTKKRRDIYIKFTLKRFIFAIMISFILYTPIFTKAFILYPTLVIEANINIGRAVSYVGGGIAWTAVKLYSKIPYEVKRPIGIVSAPFKNMSQIAGIKPVALKHKLLSPVRLFDLVNPFKWFVR